MALLSPEWTYMLAVDNCQGKEEAVKECTGMRKAWVHLEFL